jgi:hypothetical protein
MITRMATLGLLALVAGCSTVRAHHDYDPQAPFTTYRTVAWVTDQPLIKPEAGAVAGGRAVNPLLEPVIRSSVERHLEAKGYQLTRDPGSADLVVSFTVGARDKIEVNSYPVGAGYHYRGWGYGGGYATDVDTYTEGVLALDFFDRKTKQAVWHGYGTKRLSSSPPTPEKRKENVDEAVDAILAGFPARGAAPAAGD